MKNTSLEFLNINPGNVFLGRDNGGLYFAGERPRHKVEINYNIGLLEESMKYANVLGYNYQSSKWYKKSYKIFNKDYKEIVPKKVDKNKKGVIDKFKKLFD